MKQCEWCGKAHDPKRLCEGRPKWSRRGFISMFAAGIAGAVVAGPIVAFATPNTYVTELDAREYLRNLSNQDIDDYVLGVLRREPFSFEINFQKDLI